VSAACIGWNWKAGTTGAPDQYGPRTEMSCLDQDLDEIITVIKLVHNVLAAASHSFLSGFFNTAP
jgi:hypothetical protein